MKRHLSLVSLILFFFTALQANDSTITKAIFEDFYQPDKILEITLQFDCKKIIRQKNKQEKFPASITYQCANGEMITRSIKVRTRGKLRLDICGFPPLKLDFNKKNLQTENFVPEIDEIKMVTHCSNLSRSDQNVAKEFLTYKLYNLITEYSFRVQLLNVRYLDEKGELFAENLAFLIEPTDALAMRLNCRESEARLRTTSALHPDVHADLLLYEYMIGNVDWDISALHNAKLLQPLKGGAYIPVPYDFDISGVVRAHYAAPQDRVKQRFVGQRMLLGEFVSEDCFNASVQRFLDAEEAIMNTCANFTYLDEKEREKIVDYLEPFFEKIKNPNISPGKF